MAQPVTLRSPISAPLIGPNASGQVPAAPPADDDGFIRHVQNGLRGFFGLPPIAPPPVQGPLFAAPAAATGPTLAPPQVAPAPLTPQFGPALPFGPASPMRPVPPPPLKLGDRGPRVTELQQLLKEAEFFEGKPNGVFDRATQRAVWDFQQAFVGPDGAQLGVDGVAGQTTVDTLRLLKRAYDQQQQQGGAAPSPEKVAPSYYEVGQLQVIAPGSRGPDVQRAQALLQALGYNVQQTGDYDAMTEAAVADFQKRYVIMNGRPVETDSKIGRATGYAMASALESMRESPMSWLDFSRTVLEQPAKPAPEPTPDEPNPTPLPPMPTAPYVGSPTLKAGSTDKAQVIALQNQLIRLGYGLKPDGDFGKGTTAALTDFQRLYTLFTGTPLTADGTCNDASREALATAMSTGLMNRLPAALRHATVDTGYVRGVPFPIVLRDLGDGGGHKLESRAALAYYALHATAQHNGVSFTANEGFRSWGYQKELSDDYADEPGHAAAPGYSTHQNGIAIDAHGPTDRDNDWLADHARDFGFILPGYKYQKGKQVLVETWHREYRVDRMPNAARAFYGLPKLGSDPTPTSPPPAQRRRAPTNKR